jgi:AraC-like DNA-binding protein
MPEAAPTDTWSGEIVLATGVVVYVGPGAAAARHRHDAIQIICSPNRPVVLGTEPGTVITHAAIVASRESHHFEANGAPIAIVLVEPSGQLGRRLNAVAQRSTDLTALNVNVRFPITTHPTVTVEWARSLIASITGDTTVTRPDGVRAELREACRFIDTHLQDAPQLADTANHVGYSPRQLRRGFADEIGMPYRRYVLWRRLRHALLAVRDGADLTTAAAAAGFADSAHLSRTFRQTFGLTPSEVLPLLTVAAADFVGDN